MFNLRLPKIDGATEQEQLLQMKKYLFQLVEELNFVLNSSGITNGHQPPNANG